MDWSHEQLEGWIGRWFVDRGWSPCFPEMDVGSVDQGGNLPHWARNDEHFIDYQMRWNKMTLEQAQQRLKQEKDRRWIADVAGMMLVSKSRFEALRLGQFWEMDEIIPYYMTWLCEVKVTRQDFLKDDKFDKPPQAHWQFLATPKGLIRHEEIPKGWGLLEVGGDEYGGRVYKTMDRVVLNEVSPEATTGFIEQMIWTMWWRYRDGVHREFHRKTEYEKMARDSDKVSAIIEATVRYIRAESRYLEDEGRGTLRDYLLSRKVKRTVKQWTIEEARKLREEFQCQKGS